MLASDAQLPRLVVFDLDHTLWTPELYTLRHLPGYDDASPPFPVAGEDVWPAALRGLCLAVARVTGLLTASSTGAAAVLRACFDEEATYVYGARGAHVQPSDTDAAAREEVFNHLEDLAGPQPPPR